MGWTYVPKKYGQTIKDFFSEQFDSESGKVIACYSKLNVAYIAYETKQKEVIAIVCLLHRKNGYFGYKDMDETMGPFSYDAPAKLLNILTPTTNEWALQWRMKCQENLKKRKNRKKFSVGDTVKFEKPIYFGNGNEEDTFTVKSLKPLRFVNHYTTYRIRKDTLDAIPWKIV